MLRPSSAIAAQASGLEGFRWTSGGGMVGLGDLPGGGFNSFANGVSGLPRIPSLPGLDEFAGEVVHSHSFTDGSRWRGKKALVLGTGTAHAISDEMRWFIGGQQALMPDERIGQWVLASVAP